MILFLVSALLILGASTADAASDSCKDILSLQTTDELQESYASSRTYAQEFNLCDLKSASECASKDWNAVINVVVKAVPVGLKGGSAESRCQALYSQYCAAGSASGDDKVAIDNTRSLLKADVVTRMIAAWEKCMIPDKVPTAVALAAPNVQHLGDFPLIIRFASVPNAAPPVLVSIDAGTTATCNLSHAQGAKILDQTSVLCKRNSKAAGAIVVGTSYGVRSVVLEPIIDTAEASSTAPAVGNEFVGIWNGSWSYVPPAEPGSSIIQYVICRPADKEGVLAIGVNSNGVSGNLQGRPPHYDVLRMHFGDGQPTDGSTTLTLKNRASAQPRISGAVSNTRGEQFATFELAKVANACP